MIQAKIKLVRLSKISNYRELDAKVIKKMQKVCKDHRDKLKPKDGKLFIKDEKEINLELKMLGDYYNMEKYQEKHTEHLQVTIKNNRISQSTTKPTLND